MKLEIAEKLHAEQYKTKMSFQEYISLLQKGLRLAENFEISNRNVESAPALNIALEYNIEIMVSCLCE